MILVDPQPKAQHRVPVDEAPDTGTSSAPPPTFEESTADHVVLDFSEQETYAPPGGEEPPAFAPYEAKYSISRSGTVISHDRHLNEDGEALYRFLLSQASTPPALVLRCKGSHTETHTRLVTHTNNRGESKLRSEQYSERVVDFDFRIDIGQHIVGEPTHWSVGDSAPAYRGRMFREVGFGEDKRKARRGEVKAAKAWDSERNNRGFPPWVGSDYAWHEDQPHLMHRNSILKSSWSLREWADHYCASRKYLKEFNYHKVVYGWNFDALKAATRSTINSTHYRGDVTVEFEQTQSVISVRSENRLSRTLSSPWLKFILWLLVVYPFIWLFKRFHSRGGGQWTVCGGAYALKRIEQVEPDYPSPDRKTPEAIQDTLDSVDAFAASSSSDTRTESVRTRVIGLKEGEWFRQWEGTIRRAVLNRLQDKQPLVHSDDRPAPPAFLLDGY
ncbi:hypothetical protein BV22DRAFT_1034293 [Leucogyrophana mollusca]|uniref:Uncharacterized protein n=1 Tax=Leucogyrophana mollusca TaxID=85980 RepID=A0ACB8BHJ7_9AGAM|nr:hypothetical protein BV22DRAFT_1034293 [Leucogyrophana mollusca]